MAVYELLGCGGCSACSRGEDNVCRDVVPGAIGITRDGGMADHVVVPARSLVAVGDVDPVHAAPLTDAGMTALHAVERGRALLEPGEVAVVVGIGGLGHLAVQLLRATSEVRVLAVDVDRARLDIGADDGIAAGPGAAEDASRRTPVARSTPSSTSSARRRASTSPRRSPSAAAGSSSRAAAAGCRSPRGWEPAVRPTVRSRWCTPSAEPVGISRGRSRSPSPAASGRTSRSTTSRPPVGCLQIWTPGRCSGAPCSCLEERRVSCCLM
jgi:hypothetical protein